LRPQKIIWGVVEVGKLAANNGEVHEWVQVPGRSV
jgi:hypothetical protein